MIENGANVNIANFNGTTALIFAATYGRKEIVASLLECGADTSIKDDKGYTAKDHAEMQGLNEVVVFLVSSAF